MTKPLPETSIAIFLSSLNGGGVTWAMYRLAQGLKKAGMRVTFLSATGSGELASRIAAEFEVIDFHARSTFRSFPKLAQYLAGREPDILISNILQGNLASVVARFLVRVKTRLILIDHALVSNELSLCSKPKQLIEGFLVPRLYRHADKIVAVSSAAAADTQRTARLSPRKLKIIYNPVIPYDFDNQVLGNVEHPWLRDKKEPVVFGVGRLSPEKGFSDLIKAFAIVVQHRKARLIVAGEGKERQELESLVGALGLTHAVSLAGFQKDILAWIKKADLLVQPSLSEAFGNAVVEALACGTPVVCTKSGGPSEILENGIYGTLVPPRDPSALAQAIEAALARQHDIEALKRRGLSFTIDAAADHYIALFSELIQERR